MKNLATILFCCFSMTALFGQTRIFVLTKSATETTLSLHISGIDKTSVTTPQGEAFSIGMEDGTPLLQEGNPDLPKFATSLMIPNTGNMAVEIIASDFQDYPNIAVAPSKGNLLRKVDPATVPFSYSTQYEHDAFFPGQLADLQQPFVMRDLRGQALWIYPVQYNPVSKVLRVYSSITLRVYHTGGQGENEASPNRERNISQPFQQLYQKLFLNYDKQFLSNNRNGEEPEQMLVIAQDALIPALEPYIAWKRQMGIHTTVVPSSEVGADPAVMYNFVKDYYTAHNISYLLLVGDEYALTPMVRPGSNYSCDNCLGYMEGEDHYPEVFVGRFHAANVEELNIMINRNLDYEKTPLGDTLSNWCGTGMASASNEGQGIGDDNQADYEQGNEWKSKHLTDGFERYWEFYDGNHEAISPTPGDETADKPGNPVNSQLVAVMNDPGISIYNYTGHGWEQGLASGNFNTDAVKNLRNVHRYPIVIAVACCTGNFTNNAGGDCLGEAMQRAGNLATGEAWGGIAGFYSSDFQSWAPPMEGQDGMNQYLLDADGVTLDPNIGAMATYGNALMIAAYGQGGIDMADTWNPFCDPTTVPRTALPLTLTANHATGAIIGTNSLEVACAVEGALISLYWQGQTLAVGTVSGGIALLQFPALDNVGDMTVTATHFNHTPYQGNVVVTPSAGAFVINQAIVLDDSASGNNNQKADYGETIALNLTLSNLGDLLANATSATLETNDIDVVITDGAELFGDIDAGISVEKLAAFEFSVNDDVANGHIVTFKLRIEYNGGQIYQSSLPVKLQAPELALGTLQLEDFPGGDGDNRLESGEVATITIKNLNVGSSKSLDALGQLSSDSPWLSIGPAVALGPLDPVTGTADAVFEVTVSNNAPQAVPANFNYVVNAGNYSAEKDFGPFTINAILETFESHNYTSYPWDLGGEKPWFITPIGAYTGTYASRSGIITHNQQSIMNLTLDFISAGTISFARRVASEQDYDFLRFLIDDVEIEKWSGVVPWAEVSYPLSAGIHKLSWIYVKDAVASANSDRAWVDDISLPPHQVVVGTFSPNQGDFQVSISPNPSSGIARLQWEIPETQRMDIMLFNGLGHQLQSYPATGNRLQGPQSLELDLRDLSPGVYFVQLRGETGNEVLKLVKE
ncbi:MAG: C25 family cysteine peptidase [Saprospiraceae bacterium]|nr:C25 family cysteine peptidase [Saprospiraceae bacterium]